jgi:hypothetical protein
MLQSENIKNLSELNQSFIDKHKKSEFFLKFIDILKLGKFHAVFSTAKVKGIASVLLIRILITFPFIDQKNVHSFTNSFWSSYFNFGKDAYYRLKNNERINWRSFLTSVTLQLLHTLSEQQVTKTDDASDVIKAFIFDDTVIAKTSDKTEGVSKIWNHVIQKHVLGYVLLVMGYYNGSVFIPLNFSFHREKGKNKKRPYSLTPSHLKNQFRKKRDKNTSGYQRKKELDISKIKSMVKMLKQAVSKGIDAQYVLTDSWFTCWETVHAAIENNLIYIGMFSKIKTKFTYNNKSYNYNQIRGLNRNNIKRNKRYNLYYIRTVVLWKDKPIVLYFTRKGKRGNWKVLLNTDLSASFSDTIAIYQVRWSIEVFFKECKQSLQLGKCQSKNLDAQIADTTLTFIQYQFLAIRNQLDRYESLGALIRNTKAEKLELKLHERLIALLIGILEHLSNLLEDTDFDLLMSKLINDEKVFKQIKILIELENQQHSQAA